MHWGKQREASFLERTGNDRLMLRPWVSALLWAASWMRLSVKQAFSMRWASEPGSMGG